MLPAFSSVSQKRNVNFKSKKKVLPFIDVAGQDMVRYSGLVNIVQPYVTTHLWWEQRGVYS